MIFLDYQQVGEILCTQRGIGTVVAETLMVRRVRGLRRYGVDLCSVAPCNARH